MTAFDVTCYQPAFIFRIKIVPTYVPTNKMISKRLFIFLKKLFCL